MIEPSLSQTLLDVGTYHSNTFVVRNPSSFKQWLDRWDMIYTLTFTDGVGKSSDGDVLLLGEQPLQATLQIMNGKPTRVMDDLIGNYAYNEHFLEELALFLIDNTAVMFHQLNFVRNRMVVGYVEVVNSQGKVLRTTLTDLIPTITRHGSRYTFIDSKEQRTITYYAHIGKPMDVRYRPPEGIIHRILTFYEKLTTRFEYDQFPQVLVDRDCKVVFVFPSIELVSDFIHEVRNNYLNWYPSFNGRRIMLHERLEESSIVDFLRLSVCFNDIQPVPISSVQDVIDTDKIKELEPFVEIDVSTEDDPPNKVYFALFKTSLLNDKIARFGNALIRTPLGDYIYAYQDITT